MLTSVINYLIAPISLVFAGKLGSTELAAVGLSISIFHVAGLSIVTGLLTASETLFSQVSFRGLFHLITGSRKTNFTVFCIKK